MKRYAVVALILLVGGSAAALTWKLWPRTSPPQPPALDPSGIDPMVWRAIETARKDVDRAPESVRAWGRLGMVLLAHQFRAKSVVCLARAEQLDPHDARWPYYQAMAVRRSDPESAIAHLRRALAAGSEQQGPRLLVAELLLQRGRLDEAETLFRAILLRQPDNSRAHLGLAQTAFERDDLTVCLEHLRQAEDDPHTRKAAHVFLAEVQQRRGDRAAAEKSLHDGQELPDDAPWPDPLYEPVQEMVVGYLQVITRAAHLLHQNQPEQAIPLLQRAAEDYPESSWACMLLGRAWIRAGNFAAAKEALHESVRRSPDSVEGHFYLGVVLSEQKDFAAAIPYFRKAAQLKPDYALAWYNLGFCCKQQGDRAGAREAFQKAIDCKPQFAPARINLGELLAEEGQLDAAEEQLRQGVQMSPNDSRARHLLETVRKRRKL
ncbi:MAG TPA: tetratricopeptide repeat protein [Gemmataceae bacterium]|nr:tetratricopeptide repeat protein [Gemmataceae bacterium]